jgi:hypothetical protein
VVRKFLQAVAVALPLLCAASDDARSVLATRNAELLDQLQQTHGLTSVQMTAIRAVFARSSRIGQGNPAITRHPLTPQQCQLALQQRGIRYENPRFERICGRKYMAPLYDPVTQDPERATACIDQFEFPDIPCTYPVVWVRASEAAQLCAAEGKRLCDAHEWEDACDGRTEPPAYRFDLARDQPISTAVERMRAAHNVAEAGAKRWSYGSIYQTGVCATGSFKTPGCDGGNWARCGSNTYPAGSFPACHSPLDVFDLNGNAAEHMNLPLDIQQMSSRGSTTLGYTEMKGSWFIFDTYRAHEDWCRWRAPFWHGSRVMDPASHENYHLGFRCCESRSAAIVAASQRRRLPDFLARPGGP